MKQLIAVFILVTLSGIAGAQTAAFPAQAGTMNAAREKISAERARLTAGFLAEDAACYSRFFVNNCLDDVNSRRRETLSELRRHEISLNDEERRRRGAEQVRKTEGKLSLEKQHEAADGRAKALEDHQSRLDSDQKKRDERASASSGDKARGEANADRLKGQQEKARARTDRQTAGAEEVNKFNERQRQAQDRRAQREADLLKQVKPPAKSLPLPE